LVKLFSGWMGMGSVGVIVSILVILEDDLQRQLLDDTFIPLMIPHERTHE
jgi:hypothetical protein